MYTEITGPDKLCNPFPYARGTEEYRALMESEELAREWGDRIIGAYRDPSAGQTWRLSQEGWRAAHPGDLETPKEAWSQTGPPVQAVPSIIIPPELNFLINTSHPRSEELEWSSPEPFQFDPRAISPSFR